MTAINRISRLDQDIAFGCALIELGAALDAAGLLPDDHPALDIVRNYVAAADAGAFGTGQPALPQPPRGARPLPQPPTDTHPEITAARERAARKPSGPNWARRRKKSNVVDLQSALNRAHEEEHSHGA